MHLYWVFHSFGTGRRASGLNLANHFTSVSACARSNAFINGDSLNINFTVMPDDLMIGSEHTQGLNAK
jgi:hypothetical protein